MALRTSLQAAMRMPAPGALNGSSPVCAFGQHTTVAGAFALNDVVEMIPWPAGTIITSLKVKSEDLDSNGAPAVALDIGILTGAWLEKTVDNDGTTARTCGTEFAAASNIGQAGGGLDVGADKLLGLAASSKDRSIGVKVQTAAATLVAGGKLTFAASFMPVPHGVIPS